MFIGVASENVYGCSPRDPLYLSRSLSLSLSLEMTLSRSLSLTLCLSLAHSLSISLARALSLPPSLSPSLLSLSSGRARGHVLQRPRVLTPNLSFSPSLSISLPLSHFLSLDCAHRDALQRLRVRTTLRTANHKPETINP